MKKTYLEKSTFYICNECGVIVQDCSLCYKEFQFEDVVYCHNSRKRHFCEECYKKSSRSSVHKDAENKEVNKT